MAIKYTVAETESSSLVTTELDSLADGSESSQFAFDNADTTEAFPYCKVRVALGSITPGTGANLTLRLYGPNADSGSTPLLTKVVEPSTGTGAKVIEFGFLVPGPHDFDATIQNDCGVALAASANDVYAQFFAERDV